VSSDAVSDRPTAVELLEAVREYLADDVLTATEGRVAFHARVAMNVLAQLGRELTLGPALAEAHRIRLIGLGVETDAELAAAIGSGDLDDRYDEVAAALRSAVLDKLAIANPGYAST
jgi:hypothetical protein